MQGMWRLRSGRYLPWLRWAWTVHLVHGWFKRQPWFDLAGSRLALREWRMLRLRRLRKAWHRSLPVLWW
jgi:hypothetical protein